MSTDDPYDHKTSIDLLYKYWQTGLEIYKDIGLSISTLYGGSYLFMDIYTRDHFASKNFSRKDIDWHDTYILCIWLYAKFVEPPSRIPMFSELKKYLKEKYSLDDWELFENFLLKKINYKIPRDIFEKNTKSFYNKIKTPSDTDYDPMDTKKIYEKYNIVIKFIDVKEIRKKNLLCNRSDSN